MQTLRQLQALGLLVVRSWYRMGPRLRGGRKPEPTRGFSAVLMRLVFAAVFLNFGYAASARVLHRNDPLEPATWTVLGAGLFAVGLSLALELPLPRTATLPLKSELLEMLPLSRLSKLLLSLAQTFSVLLFTSMLAVAARHGLQPDAPVAAALALAVTLFVAFTLAGACLGKLLRLLVSPYRASRLAWLSTVFLLAAMLLLQLAPLRRVLPAPPFGLSLGRALLGQDAWSMAGKLSLACLLFGALFFRLERSQELSAPVRSGTTASEFQNGADMRRLEQVLTRREPGGRFLGLIVVGFNIAYVLAFALLLRDKGLGVRVFWNMAAAMTLQLTSQVGMQRASRGALRDLLARPLLGSLPILPRDTLTAKTAALRRTLMLLAAPICLSLVGAYQQAAWLPELAWRSAFTLVAVWIFASTATYVAFLTLGLGSTKPRGGVFGSLESFLVLIPFASVLFAAGPGSAALSLLTLGALTFEARRAARSSIEWLDDPEREHGTEIWKALVAFGAFQGAQLLAQQVTTLFGDSMPGSVRMLASYVLAASALWLLTQREQEASRPTYRAALAPLGLIAGAVSAGFAWIYLNLVKPTAPESGSLEVHGVWEGVLVAVAVVTVAPLVEERFFRGWLQPALETALGDRRYLAPILTGLAFAAVHPAYSFAPVLVLGLINGFIMLRYRSLSACLVAHAVHNALALWFAS